MSIRSSREQRQHASLIEALVESLEQRGYNAIRAEHHPAFDGNRPEPVYSEEHGHYFVPDVIAEKDGRRVLFEVETAGSLEAPSTRVELTTFAAHASANGMLYYLVVPEALRRQAESVLEMIEGRSPRATFVLSLPA